MDVTSALNMLLYADINSKQQGAEWVIFHREDTAPLRDYLNATKTGHKGDPILSQAYFLQDEDLEELKQRGVQAFRFVQKPGEVVFINAGCAHQVLVKTRLFDTRID